MTQQEVIKAFMKSLDKTSKKGSKALDAAIKACSPFSSFQTAKNAIIRDCKNAKSADDFLKTYCGIDYDTEDNGAITGSDAGGSTTKTDESVVPESGSLKTYKKNSFKVKGLTVKLGDGKTYSDLNDSEKFIWNGLYTWWVKSALNLIAESYGDNFSFTNKYATVKEISVTFNNDEFPAATYSTYNLATGKTAMLNLNINMNYWDVLKNNFGRTIAHEMTHAVMKANILLEPTYYGLPGFVREGLAELTIGIENSRKDLIQGLTATKFQKGLDVSNTGTNESFMYEGGYIFFRYLARQAGDLTIENSTSNKTVQSFYGNDTVTNYASGVSISSGAGNDSVSNWDWNNKYVTIQSGSGNDTISNVGSYSTLNAGSGNDSIHNWSDNVKIYGGSGNDKIINDNYYGKGDNVTIDGGAGNDYIDNYGNNVSIVGGTGNDTIWSYGLKATINGGNGNDYLVGDEGANKIIGGSGNDKMWGEDGNDSLKGDAGNDWLIGGDGNDTLNAGKGNDSLWGGDGNDSFIYAKGDGKDVIFGFENNDLLKITGTFSASYSKSKDEVYFKVGTTSKAITLSDFTATSFHVNSSTYRISGSKLVKK